jgi:hypothetical protein
MYLNNMLLLKEQFYLIRTWISPTEINHVHLAYIKTNQCVLVYIFFWNDDFQIQFQFKVFKTAYEFQLYLLQFLPCVPRATIFFSTRLVHNCLTEQLLCHNTYYLKQWNCCPKWPKPRHHEVPRMVEDLSDMVEQMMPRICGALRSALQWHQNRQQGIKEWEIF